MSRGFSATAELVVTLYGQIKTAEQRTNAVICTPVVDGWAVTFGTARRRLGVAAARPGLSSLYQM